MSSRLMLPAFIAVLIMIGASTPAWGAQLEVILDPDEEASPFKIRYQKTVFIEYPEDGIIHDQLNGQDWVVSGTANITNPDVQKLVETLNQNIVNSGSQAHISDLQVTYNIHLQPITDHTSIDYTVSLNGSISNYLVTKDSQKSLIDMGWRGFTTNEPVIIDGVEINKPISILASHAPETYDLLIGTAADDVLLRDIMDASFILKQPMTNWHFLFDPTGINVDAGTFGLSDEIAGNVVSAWTMGESSIREGIQTDNEYEATITLDREYTVRSLQSADNAVIRIIGFGTLDVLDGVEIVGVTPEPAAGFNTTSTGDFPIFIIYGMAGLAAVAGIGFFIVSNRSLKNQSTEQQGIDPSNLVGYHTSESAGGYKTNRGEAQLRDESEYQQTRSVYDDQTRSTTTTTPPPPQQQQTTPAISDSTCGCATSADMGSECDCEMQGACLCDTTCQCSIQICKDNVNMLG